MPYFQSSIRIFMNLTDINFIVFDLRKEFEKGLSKNKPMFAFSFLILFFSLAGIPPLGGFFAKFFIFMSVIESELYALAIIGLLTTVISAFYYLKVIKFIYFDRQQIHY